MPEEVLPVAAWDAVGDRTTAEMVRMAYRLILGREPESEAAVQHGLSYRTVSQLRAAFLASDEFRPKIAAMLAHTVLPAQPLGAPALDVEWLADAPTAAALLAHVQRAWNRLGLERPHWSVLSSDNFLPEQIAANEKHFYASGADDTAQLVATLARHGASPATHPHILEFGCGVGRVTPHLARRFARVTALDVSASHMAMAKAQVERSDVANVTFQLVGAANFAMAAPFDLWFSRIVLQHNPPPIIAMILRRALACLAPDGLAVFQIPTYASMYRFRIADYLAAMDRSEGIEMHLLPQEVVFRLAAEAGCVPVEVVQDRAVGAGWISQTFTLRKRSGN